MWRSFARRSAFTHGKIGNVNVMRKGKALLNDDILQRVMGEFKTQYHIASHVPTVESSSPDILLPDHVCID